nr:hypothetical protein [Tanacetum cinerariifolium]
MTTDTIAELNSFHEYSGGEEEHVKDVTTGNAAQRDDTTAHGEVPTVSQEPSIPSSTPPTPPQPPQDLPSTSQVQHIPPQSPQAQPQTQPQPQQTTDFPTSLLQEALDACASLTKKVKHLEYDKIAQALEIKKLKKRVKKLEKRNRVRVLKLRRLKRVGTSQRIDTSDDTVLDDESNQGRIIDEMDKDDDVALIDDKKDEEAKVDESAQAKEDEPAEVLEVVDVVTTAKLITEVVTATSEIITAASTTISVAEPQVPAATITAAPVKVAAVPRRRRKGVVIRDPEEESTTSSIILRWMKNMQESCMLSLTKILTAMFEKPDGQAQVWKNKKTMHDQAKVKSWKLLESCGIRITWVDAVEAVPEIAPMTLGEVNTRVTELAELHEHDRHDLYALLEDAQDSRTHISQRVTMDSQWVDFLIEDRIAHQETILIVEKEVYAASEA